MKIVFSKEKGKAIVLLVAALEVWRNVLIWIWVVWLQTIKAASAASLGHRFDHGGQWAQ